MGTPLKAIESGLIKGAGMAADQFFDVGKAFSGGGKGSDYTKAIRLRDKLAKRNAAKKQMRAYVGGMQTIDVNKIEESMRPEVTEFLTNANEQYNQAAECASREDAGNSDYMECVQAMNKINSSIVNLSGNLTYFKNYREEYIDDFKFNRISNQPGSNTDLLNGLFNNPNFDIEIHEGGDVDLMHDGNIINVMEFDKNPDYRYDVKNSIGLNAIMKLNSKAANLKGKISGGLEDSYRYNVGEIVGSMDRSELLSMVYDDDLQKGKTLYNSNIGTEYTNPNTGVTVPFTEMVANEDYEDSLRLWLEDTYLKMMKTSAQQGFDQQKNDWKKDYKDALSENKLILNKDISKWPKDLQDQVYILLAEMKNDALNPPGE